jgi:PPOX class probable F420-dependent enzyme
MTPNEARARFVAGRVARLATVDATGRPHLVPLVFAVSSAAGRDTLYSAVDGKPKRTTALRRLSNVRGNPRVCLLVDHYDEDWTQLWWVRADGAGRVLDAAAAESARARTLLAERYEAYRSQPPDGAVLAVEVATWRGWAAR